jgi:hypothetical protein
VGWGLSGSQSVVPQTTSGNFTWKLVRTANSQVSVQKHLMKNYRWALTLCISWSPSGDSRAYKDQRTPGLGDLEGPFHLAFKIPTTGTPFHPIWLEW